MFPNNFSISKVAQLSLPVVVDEDIFLRRGCLINTLRRMEPSKIYRFYIKVNDWRPREVVEIDKAFQGLVKLQKNYAQTPRLTKGSRNNVPAGNG